eukprot:gnl/TRDRNA2_/TRDRNA2_164507_c1_seq2.p1 gnl/TRDRNA2_/TRDRNA2_164507_c1~~gnl/TRDRNA2_/TRDRNA2_164507_c1_seq2.p1  ORF type:complete len:399 (+),score=63.74 gnl/TRDRNA2_/TRDRNA2_164507_c1_seq2:107-1198(+)
MEDCQECVGPEDCFADCFDNATIQLYQQEHDLLWPSDEFPGARCIKVTGDKMWTRFVSIIHVKCEVDSIGANFQYRTVQGGTLSLHWDDTRLEAFTEKSTARDWSSALVPEDKGGHKFMVEFVPDSPGKTPAGALYNMLGFFTQKQFAKCMDTRNCLEELDKTPAGRSLRNSNRFLLQCLTSSPDDAKNLPMVGVECHKWRKCLEAASSSSLLQVGDAGDHGIKHLLEAAAESNATEANERAEKREGCVYPPTEDPMAWDCDCWEQMHKRCNAIEVKAENLGLCLRAQFCRYPEVCDGWHGRNCVQDDVKQMQFRLNVSGSLVENKTKVNTSAALLGRATENATTGAKLAADLDAAVGNKACA